MNFNLRHKADIDALNTSINFFQSNGDNTDLSPFFNDDGKLLMYQGWSDPVMAPTVSINYYTAIANRLYGGDFSQLQDNARLFMVPGMHHCGGGPGPNAFDPLTPADLLGYHTSLGLRLIKSSRFTIRTTIRAWRVDRTMPLCPYPQVAAYVSGPVNQASSWTCANPPAPAHKPPPPPPPGM